MSAAAGDPDAAAGRPEAGQGALGRWTSRTLGRFTAWAGVSPWRRVLLLTVLSTLLLAPGFAANPPTDRDEARFAQAARQMVETGDLIDIRFQDGPRHEKPVFTYWAQSIAILPFGGTDAPIWAHRLPSLIAAILAVLATSWAMRPLVGPRAGFLAAAMTAGVVLLSFEARTAKSDALLFLAIVVAMGALARLWFGENDSRRTLARNAFIFWTAVAVGFLIKGPIILLPTVGAIVWMSVWGRGLSPIARLAPAWGLAWLAAVAGPWYVAIAVRTEGAFFGASLGDDLLGKVATELGGGAPPGTFVAMFFGTFWPWTPLALIAIPYVWRWRRAPETAFLLGWIVPTWIVFEVASGTKLPHYVLPVYPAMLALAAAAALDGGAAPRGWLFWIGAVAFAIPAIALPAAFAAGPPILAGRIEPLAIAGAAASFLALWIAWRWLLRGVWIGFVRAALLGAGLVYFTAYQASFPTIEPIWVSGRMAETAQPYRECVAERAGRSIEEAPFGSVGYHEPSLVFVSGRETRLLDAEGAADWLAERGGALVWIERRRAEGFFEAAAAAGVAPVALTETTGHQYNGGRDLELTLYAADGDPFALDCPDVAR